MNSNFKKLFALSALVFLVSQTYPGVIAVKSEASFLNNIRNNSHAVVYFYSRATRSDIVARNLKIFNAVSTKNRYVAAGLAFIVVDLDRDNLSMLKKRYRLPKESTFALFKNGKIYSDEFLTGAIISLDLEDFIEDYFRKFLKSKTKRYYKPQKTRRRYTTYYSSPRWGYSYSPSYYYPYESYYYDPYYYGRPQVGFGFSFGI